jgi:hypothetical protein
VRFVKKIVDFLKTRLIVMVVKRKFVKSAPKQVAVAEALLISIENYAIIAPVN